MAVSSVELRWYARGCRDRLVGDVISEGHVVYLPRLKLHVSWHSIMVTLLSG